MAEKATCTTLLWGTHCRHGVGVGWGQNDQTTAVDLGCGAEDNLGLEIGSGKANQKKDK